MLSVSLFAFGKFMKYNTKLKMRFQPYREMCLVGAPCQVSHIYKRWRVCCARCKETVYRKSKNVRERVVISDDVSIQSENRFSQALVLTSHLKKTSGSTTGYVQMCQMKLNCSIMNTDHEKVSKQPDFLHQQLMIRAYVLFS